MKGHGALSVFDREIVHNYVMMGYASSAYGCVIVLGYIMKGHGSVSVFDCA